MLFIYLLYCQQTTGVPATLPLSYIYVMIANDTTVLFYAIELSIPFMLQAMVYQILHVIS